MNLFKEGFHLKAKNGIEIDIPINAKVTILAGDDADDKTKMIRSISTILRLPHEIASCSVDKSKIVIVKDMDAYRLLINQKQTEDYIVFIDKFDLTDFRESIPFIKDSNNYFIICAHRTLPSCSQEADSILEMHHDGLRYKPISIKAFS